MSIHQRLSASGSPTWIYCHGSVAYIEFLRAEGKIPKVSKDTPWSILGTAVHAILEYCVNHNIDPTTLRPLKVKRIAKMPLKLHDLKGAKVYWQFIQDQKSYYNNTFTERKYDLSNIYKMDVGGTADITQLKRREMAHVGDYKNGKTFVPISSAQLRIYGLGVYHEFYEEYKFKNIMFSIGQPNCTETIEKVRTDVIPVKELLKWEDQYLIPATEKIRMNSATLNPGEKQCQWCDARAVCEARAKQELQIAQLDFKGLAEPRQDLPSVKSLTKEQIAFIVDNKKRLTNFLAEVEKYALEMSEKGDKIPGYQIKEKFGNRKLKSHYQVSRQFRKHNLDRNILTKQETKNLTITELETYLKTVLKWETSAVNKFMSSITDKPRTGIELIKTERQYDGVFTKIEK